MSDEAIRRLFRQLDSPFTAEAIFDCFADAVYFIKNDRAEYVAVNRTLVERVGVSNRGDVLGKTAKEVYPPPLGYAYWKQDLHLLKTGEPVLNQLELHLSLDGSAVWCTTNKFPLFRGPGKVIGLVGFSRDLHSPERFSDNFENVAAAMHHARKNLSTRLTIEQLAEVADMNVYAFDQQVRRMFHLTTGQLLLKLRMDLASERLRNSAHPIAAVAIECGYADQSAFTRQFRRATGLTPGEFRRIYGIGKMS